jgi:phosphate transport system permease protein
LPVADQKMIAGIDDAAIARYAVSSDTAGYRNQGPGADRLFFSLLNLSALLVLVLVAAISITLLVYALPSIRAFGFSFLIEKTWDPVTKIFGALPFLLGTLLTSFIALIISIPFSLSVAIFLGEYSTKGILSSMLKSAVELLAGIPSIVYGFWGIFVLVPVIRNIELKLGVAPFGVGIFTASVVLAIMIIPYSASIATEVIQLVPSDLKEAAFSLGATRFEVIRKIVVTYARSGIFAGILLALGRALGETMAVTMVIGNSHFLPTSIFSPGNSMASVIANEFTEATEKIYLSSLVQIALLLFVVTMIVNLIGKYIIGRMSVELSGSGN